jgi:hypothetical protein
MIASLPAEIISAIAVESDAKSVLRLSATCRTLHQVCYHGVIFKQIIASQLAEPRRELTKSEIEPYLRRLAIRCQDVQTWARYALAEDCIGCLSLVLIPNGDPQHVNSLKGLMKFQLAIAVAQHPSFKKVSTMSYIVNSVEHIVDSVELSKTYGLESGILVPFMVALTLDYPSRLELIHNDMIPKWPVGEIGWRDKNWRTVITAEYLDSSYDTLFRTIIWLKASGRRQPELSNLLTSLPTLSSLQFPDYLNNIVPFGSGHDFVLESLDFLTTGVWSGHYTYLFPLRRQVDGPMNGIQFHQDVSRTTEGIIHLVAENGTDSHGSFELRLSLAEQTCKFRGSKKYHNAPWSWSWCGMITPFGLVGQWGQSGHSSGCLWLYKTVTQEASISIATNS